MRIKILNLNIWLGGLLIDNVIEFINKENPDILLLQEVHDSKDTALPPNFRTIEQLHKRIDLEYHFFDPAFIKVYKGMKAPAGNAILSRFPIKGQGSVDLGGKWGEYKEEDGNFESLPRKIQHAEINIEEKTLNVFNTQGVWGKDGRDNDERIRMGKTISGIVSGKENVVLGGDFNVNPDTKTIGLIEKKLRNVFANELSSTFNMKHKTDPGYATAVVDMIFVSPEIKILDHYTSNADVSDHVPLVVILEV